MPRGRVGAGGGCLVEMDRRSLTRIEGEKRSTSDGIHRPELLCQNKLEYSRCQGFAAHA